MDNKKRIIQANLNNLGGAFSVAYEAQQKLQEQFVFDYFSPDRFVENEVYRHLLSMGSKCIGGVECRSRFIKQYKVYKAFLKYLKENSYVFVHIHGDTAWKISLYFLAAKKAKVENIVVHSHSSDINGHYKRISYLLHLIAKPVIKKADFRCACSDVAAKWMFDKASEVHIIRNGVDIEKYRFRLNVRKRMRKQLRIENRIVIGHVSDYSYQKNPEFIFELIKVFKNDPHYCFLLVGNRKECTLKEFLEEEDDIHNVIFTGMVTNVQDYLNAMDVFILPSRFEGLPMCALEAQVSGLYTLVSDKVSLETRCSKHFGRLQLCVHDWEKEIQSIPLDYNRDALDAYLEIDKASAMGMADEFQKIYAGRM